MGFLDDAVNKASDALDDLTGGQETSQAQAAAEFETGEQISADDENQGGSAAPAPDGGSQPVTFDFGIPIEFIHFGKVHADAGKKFPHETFEPETAETAPEGHAIMFRDALEREAVALFGFVSSTKVSVIETNKSKGGLADVADMAGDLLGGSSATAPDPAQLDTFLSDIKTAISTINNETIVYKDIHETGKKLHETRAVYVAFCNTLNEFYIKPPSGALDQVGGVISNVPGVGKIMGTVQRFAFKMQDLYLAAYLELRKFHEKSVEDAAHDLTIAAIKENYEDHELTYPIWFKKREAETPPEPEPDNAIESAVNDVGEVIDDVYDFLGVKGSPESTPGTSALAAVFSKMKGSPETTSGALPSAAACIINGLDAAMADISGVPNFVKKVISEVNTANLELLEEIYARLQANKLEGEINSLALFEASRHALSQKLINIMSHLASGLLPGGDLSAGIPGGKKLSAKQFAEKLVEEHLSKYAEPIIAIAIGDLAGQMETSRKKAAENKAQTMEVMLGRLPFFTALMFRNIFFPMWNIVVEKVFDTVAPQVAKVVKEINKVLDKAKDGVDTVGDYKKRAENIQDKAASGVNSAGDIGDIKKAAEENPEAEAREAERKAAADKKDKLDSFYKENDKDKDFPAVSRITDGKGEKVTEEIESVLPS